MESPFLLCPPQGLLLKQLKISREQRRNGLSKNTVLDNRFSARRLLRSFSAPSHPQTTIAFGVSPPLLPLAITPYGGPEGYFSLVIIAFGAFELISPNAIILWENEIKEVRLVLGSRLLGTRPEFLDFPENRQGKEQLVFPGEGRRVPKKCLSLQCNLGVALEQDILGLSGPCPKKTTCSFPCRFSGKSRNSGLVPSNRDPKTSDTQRAQRSNKNQSRSKFSISIDIFNLARKFQSRSLELPTKNRPGWVARSKISFSLEIFNL